MAKAGKATKAGRVTRVTRAHLHTVSNRGDQIADCVAAFVGSWPFVIGQGTLLAVWMLWNAIGLLVLRFDQFPFVFLNLFMSAEAAFATPIILMAQNRQAAIDRRRDDHEASRVDALYPMAKHTQARLERIEALLVTLTQLVERTERTAA